MSQRSSENIDKVAEHLRSLRAYARKTLIHGQQLSDLEAVDKAAHLEELRAICDSFQLTGCEMTRLIFRGMFRAPRRCGCPTCQARRGEQSGYPPNDDDLPRRPFFGHQGPHA